MNILAFDTSDAVLSVALEVGPSAEGGSFWYTEVDAGTRHSELLMPCADWLCRSAGIQPEQVGLVACMEGPGSFTGLRIGFSAAKGIALAFGVPLTAVPTLDCIAEPLSFWRGITVAAIDAKKGCFFTALYRQGTRLTEYMDASPQRIADEIAQVQGSERETVILTGGGAQMLLPRLAELLPQADLTLNPTFKKGLARELLKLAKNGILHEENVSLNKKGFGPVYVRKSDAELNAGIA